MQIDNIEKPCTFWYETKDGIEVPFEFTEGFPVKEWHAQHSKSALVQHSICFGTRKGGDAWPVRFVKWLQHRMPDSWKKPTIAFSINSTINCGYPIVKYLVEQRKFTFSEACVVAGDLCERCLNICLWETNGEPIDHNYLKTSNTNCEYCEQIDPEYALTRRIWACYRTMRMEGDIAKAYKETSPNSREGFFDDPKNMERLNGKVQPVVGRPIATPPSGP